jgi:hypothetical protein
MRSPSKDKDGESRPEQDQTLPTSPVVAGELPARPVAPKRPVLTRGRVAEAQQVHPAHRARLDPGLAGDPGPQRCRLVPARRGWGWREGGGAGGLGLDGQLDRMPQPTGLNLDLEGQPAGEPVSVQQYEQPGGDLDQPQFLPRPAKPEAVDGHRRSLPRVA